tara:strand:+ start:78 stop:635 length:558 start_codon:yes stop_codon:yes gene_type:complete
MKLVKFLFFIFINIPSTANADLGNNLTYDLAKGGKLIFIRHAYAPGGGDPNNFDIQDCNTQRNLNNSGRQQAKQIGIFIKDNNIPIDRVISSEWCRCIETAIIAFNKYETKSFLNSFFSEKFAKNKNQQIKNLKKYIEEWKGNKNLVFVTHYVVISELLGYAPSSGEIIISDRNLNLIETIIVKY